MPQSITVVTQDQIKDQNMLSMTDAVRMFPVSPWHKGRQRRFDSHQQPVNRGFFMDGMRDDVEYLRSIQPRARGGTERSKWMIFVAALWRHHQPVTSRPVGIQSARSHSRVDLSTPRGCSSMSPGIHEKVAVRLNGMFESSRFSGVHIKRHGISPTATPADRPYQHYFERRVLSRRPYRRSRHSVFCGAAGHD